MGKISTEYRAWYNMLDRCYNPKNKQYYDYGGRGVRVCDRWITSFENFLLDMGEKANPKLTLERENNHKDYSPSNCSWESRFKQNLNRRTNKNNKSGVVGVSWCKQQKQWRATICVNHKMHQLGRFDPLEEAISVRKEFEELYHTGIDTFLTDH